MNVNRPAGSGRVVVVDYGGVLTNPISDTIGQFASHLGCLPEDLFQAMVSAAGQGGEPPMARLERAEITEVEFLSLMSAALSNVTGRPTDLATVREAWFLGRTANAEMLAHIRGLRSRGQRLALLTNNVLEWESRWRDIVPTDELFDLVVVSCHEGTRKPEPRIYDITTSRLGVTPSSCLLVDDDEANCEAARRHGMYAHRFVRTPEAIAAIERWLASDVSESPGEELVTTCR
jgi:putative hydrolase of the HAD superfamily